MKRDANGPALSAIFVDYDNIYLSLKRKSEDAAKRFSKDAALWLREIETGALITTTSGFASNGARRIVLNRCYGNPVPRRNSHDSSTDMNSFPFIRHHFLRAGAEVIDCPPLTAQLKNSADIRIVMDVRDMITHDTYFDEFIILSSDADFTPLLHRLRAHARRTVIFANDQTASPYTAISDGEVREADLLRLLLDGRGSDRAITADAAPAQLPQPQGLGQGQVQATAPALGHSQTHPIADFSTLRRDLAAEVASIVRAANQPVPLEALADKLVRQFGHERTAGSGWAGMGGFRDLLATYLPEDLKINEQPPFVVFDTTREQRAHDQRVAAAAQPAVPQPQALPQSVQPQPVAQSTIAAAAPQPLQPIAPLVEARRLDPVAIPAGIPAPAAPIPAAMRHPEQVQVQQQPAAVSPPPRPAQPAGPTPAEQAAARQAAQQRAIQQMVARIYEACQAPPLSPPEYRIVFDIMAQEIATRGLTGAPTLDSIAQQGKDHGITLRKDDVRFILDVVSETDPWFEHGVSANLFASRFRNFVVTRCRSHGLSLSAEEIDLIDHWFAGAEARPTEAAPTQIARAQLPPPSAPVQAMPQAPEASRPAEASRQSHASGDSWWSTPSEGGPPAADEGGDEFPRIIRSRLRG